MVAMRHITVEEFASMPLQGSWELIDGEPVEMTPAAGQSNWIGGLTYAALASFAHPTKLGWVFTDGARFILFKDRAIVRSPDAAFVRRDRLAEVPDSFIPLAPDLAVEVLSPSDRMADALAKIAMDLDAGVHIIWLVNPASKTVTVFRPDTDPLLLHESDTLEGGEILPGFALPVAEFFA